MHKRMKPAAATGVFAVGPVGSLPPRRDRSRGNGRAPEGLRRPGGSRFLRIADAPAVVRTADRAVRDHK